MSDVPPGPSELPQLREEVARLHAEREQLAAALQFHERDRQLLAFEIHDGIVQAMTAAAMFFEAAGTHATFASGVEQEVFDKGLRTLRDAIHEARRLVQGLVPIDLDERGLVNSLKRLIERFQEDCDLVVEFEAEANPPALKPPVELTVLRIVQEALNNVWKHSRSSKAQVRLKQQDDSLVVTVQDWGTGFDPANVPKSRYGLIGVKERARLFGGTATITSAVGQGALVEVVLPTSGPDL